MLAPAACTSFEAVLQHQSGEPSPGIHGDEQKGMHLHRVRLSSHRVSLNLPLQAEHSNMLRLPTGSSTGTCTLLSTLLMQCLIDQQLAIHSRQCGCVA